MILVIPNPHSLHRRNAAERAVVLEVVRSQLGGPLERRLYRVGFAFYGPFFKANGEPTTVNIDNFVKPILDILAEAGGLGRNGQGDEYLDRICTGWTVEQADECRAVVTLD